MIAAEIKVHPSGWLVKDEVVKDLIELKEILDFTMIELEINNAAMFSSRRNSDKVHTAKKVYLYLARMLTSKPLTEIGSMINMDHGVVSLNLKVTKGFIDVNDEVFMNCLQRVARIVKLVMKNKYETENQQ